MKQFLKRTWPQWLALGLIIAGILIMIPRVRGMIGFYKEARYAAEHDFAAGNLSPDLLRPWMSIRYISVAYAVPQGYLFETLNIQPKRETSMISLQRLNRELGLGTVNGTPALLDSVRAAIVTYRANPVVTGLIEQRVEEWMTVQYIANSTGISSAYIFEQVGLPIEGNANKPLGFLSDELKYPGGVKALVAAVQKVIDSAP